MTELTIDQALQKGIEAHKAGKVQEADSYYTSILKVQPRHPDANHNMGVLAVGVGKVEQALPFFKTALEVNQSIEQFWLSYIDALIKLERHEDALGVFNQAKEKGFKSADFIQLEARFPQPQVGETQKSLSQEPPLDRVQALITLYNQSKFDEVLTNITIALSEFPNSVTLFNIQGTIYKKLGDFDSAIESYKRALQIKPDYAETYNNIGNVMIEKGIFDSAIENYQKAIKINPKYTEAYTNMGNAFIDKGDLTASIGSYRQALKIDPGFAENYWNLHGTSESLDEAQSWLEKCLNADANHKKAKLFLPAYKAFKGARFELDALLKSSLRNHPNMRSFSWACNLPKRPELFFNRWALFDYVVKKSKKKRPFYEFGVWRGAAFKYLVKTFKKGYGFDTFTGLPEDWHKEKASAYSSEGIVPNIEGGEFIVGKFDDTLPEFFKKKRPLASLINFDADLYSSTICALNYSKPIIDEDTFLIFDEFIMNENWEKDEYKALNEFCKKYNLSYKVAAISFFTKQVAVKLVGL